MPGARWEALPDCVWQAATTEAPIHGAQAASIACHPRPVTLAWPCAADGESSSSRLLRMGSGTEELRAVRSSSSKAAHADPPRSKSEQLHDRHRRVQGLLTAVASGCARCTRGRLCVVDSQTGNMSWLAGCAAKSFTPSVACPGAALRFARQAAIHSAVQ